MCYILFFESGAAYVDIWEENFFDFYVESIVFRIKNLPINITSI